MRNGLPYFLSGSPASLVGTADDDVQVLSIGTGDELDISSLLMLEAVSTDRENNSTEKENNPYHFAQEQRKDAQIIDYLEKRTLPKSTMDARRIVALALLFALVDRVLYYLDDKQPDVKRIVVPRHLQTLLGQTSKVAWIVHLH